MAVISSRVDDPRDKLDKATRYELWQFAQANGIKEIEREMPAMLMRPILRRRGFVNIDIPARTLGQGRGAAVSNNSAITAEGTDSLADLAKQWKESKKETDLDALSFNELRSLVKSKGIKLSRTDTREVLKAKLNGE